LIEKSLTLRHQRIRDMLAVTAAAALIAAPFAGASAQRGAANPPPRVMVPTLASADAVLGQQAADALRSRVSHDINSQNLVVISKQDIENTLKASGYSTTESLQLGDARALAVLLRADEFLDGVVTKTPTGYKIESRLVLARDQTLQQPLPAAEAPRVDQAAAMVSKSYQSARDQLANEKLCYTLFRDGKFPEAETTARAALAKYPNGTIAGVCLGSAFESENKADSAIAVAERIRAIDSRNIWALRYAAEYYGAHNNPDKQADALIGLMAADPTNERLRDQVIASLVQAHKVPLAVPIVEEAVRSNPGDPKTLSLAWHVYLAGLIYDKALATGAEMIKADTSLADTTYFIRSSAAAANISPARAAELAAQGTAKFPRNTGLLVVQANALSKSGQNAQALPIINSALRVNPRVEGGYAQKALILSNMNQPDSALAVINACAAVPAPYDHKGCAQVALKMGSDAYKAGNASKARPDLQKAVQFLLLSDKLDPSADAKFLAGASSFLIGQSAVNEAQTSKSCTLARLAKDSFNAAQENVPAGLQSYPDAAKQLLTAIPQFTPAVDDQVKRFCK
jgi:predicted Zn-dependent protease